VNDDLAVLAQLYALMRDNGIEAHYLFHAIPMQGMRHHRTSVKKGAELAMRPFRLRRILRPRQAALRADDRHRQDRAV
jgi:L-lysine 2,3-aminomutase